MKRTAPLQITAAALLTILLILLLLPWERLHRPAQKQEEAAAETAVYNGYVCLVLEDESLCIVGYEPETLNLPHAELVLPAVLDGRPVTQIGAYAFRGLRTDFPEVTTIYIPNSVGFIHTQAFAESGLSRMDAPANAAFFT